MQGVLRSRNMLERNETSLQQTCREVERGKLGSHTYVYLLYMYLQFLRKPYDWMYISSN